MSKKILLVDDDEDFVAITKSQVQRGGYKVEVAYSGEECLEKVRADKPDLILLDIMMPGLNGYETCTELKSHEDTKYIPVIFLTSVAKNLSMTTCANSRGMETEANDYITKPPDFKVLLKSINDLIDIFHDTMQEQVLAIGETTQPNFRNKIVTKGKNRKHISSEQRELTAETSRYPDKYIQHRAMADGTEFLFRPLKFTDSVSLLYMCNAISEESVAFPFFQSIKTSPHDVISELTKIDYSKDMAIGVFIKERGEEQIIGIGYYKTNQKINKAEVSFIIRDDWQEKNIDTHLLETVTEIARERGIADFEAHVLIKNKKMLSLFYNSGYTISLKKEEDVYKVSYDIRKKWSIRRFKTEKGGVGFRLEEE